MKLRFPPLLKQAQISLLDIFIVGLLLAALVAVMAPPAVKTGDVAFDSAKWRADSGGCSTIAFFSTGIRSGMAVDLARILKETRPKPARRTVEQLLGEPDISKTEHLWSYSSGTSTMDCLTFDVVFDQSGVVVDAYRIQH